MKSFPLAGFFKKLRASAREINRARGFKGTLWQDERFDRIVRDYNDYLEKWNYIRNNPVKSGLCQDLEEYPSLGARRI
jgi:putative transposase